MKKFKTFIAIAAVVAIMATILASCKGNDTSNIETTVANTTTVDATTIAGDTLPAGTEVTLITQTDAQGNTVVVAKPTTGKVTKPDATQPTAKVTKAPAKTTQKVTAAKPKTTAKKTIKTTAKKPQPTAAKPKTTAKPAGTVGHDEDDFSNMVYTTKTYSDGSFDICVQDNYGKLRVVRTDVFSRYTAYTNSRGEVKHHPSEGKRLYLEVGTQCTYYYLDDNGEWQAYG